MKNAMLINYGLCVGCHTCEVACQKHLGIKPDEYGIKLHEIGPDEIAPDKWQLDYVPVITDRCDRCADRTAEGKMPLCVQCCFTDVMSVGPLGELVKMVDGDKYVIYS